MLTNYITNDYIKKEELHMANVQNMKVNPPVNRYQEALPKIGIRPVIDGTQRYRESGRPDHEYGPATAEF